MKGVNVNELIYLFFAGNEEALPALIKYYRPAVCNILRETEISRNGYMSGLDDFCANADMLLLHCLYSYRTDRQKTFTGYYKRALINSLNDELRNRYSTVVEAENISLDSRLHEADSTLLELQDAGVDVHRDAMIRAQVTDVLADLKKQLAPMEYRCVLWKLEGRSNAWIERRSGFSRNKVRNILDRMRESVGVDSPDAF